MCWYIGVSVNGRVLFLNAILWPANTPSYVPFGKCSVSVHITHFWCTAWKVFCFCAQNTFVMYRLQSVLFLLTSQISDVSSGKCSFSVNRHISDEPPGKCSVSMHSTHFYLSSGMCSVSVHSTHFLCIVWKGFCLCAQYTFLMYHLESVLFLYTIHISDDLICAISLSNQCLIQIFCCSHCFVAM